MLSRMWQRAKPHGGQLDRALIEQVVNDRRGVAVPVSRGLSFESFIAASRMVENELPEGARWDGHDEPPTEAQSQPVATSAPQGGR
jgi:hypothetical protein